MNPLALLGRCQRFFDGENRFQHFIFHVDVDQCLLGEALGFGGDRRHRVAGVARFVDDQRLFVFGRRHDAEFFRHLLAGDHREHAVELEGARGTDPENSRMRMGAAQEFAVNHTRQIEIVRIDRFAGALCHRIDFAKRLADDGKFLFHEISFSLAKSPLPSVSEYRSPATARMSEEGKFCLSCIVTF